MDHKRAMRYTERDYLIGQIYSYMFMLHTNKRIKESKVKDVYNQLKFLFGSKQTIKELRERFTLCLEQLEELKLSYLIFESDKKYLHK